MKRCSVIAAICVLVLPVTSHAQAMTPEQKKLMNEYQQQLLGTWVVNREKTINSPAYTNFIGSGEGHAQDFRRRVAEGTIDKMVLTFEKTKVTIAQGALSNSHAYRPHRMVDDKLVIVLDELRDQLDRKMTFTFNFIDEDEMQFSDLGQSGLSIFYWEKSGAK